MEKSSINRFFRNESSDSERKLVLTWLLNPENDRYLLNWMRENWAMICKMELKDLPEGPDTEKIWQSIQQKLHQDEVVLTNIREKSNNSKRFTRWVSSFSVAASVFVLVLCGFFYLLVIQDHGKDDTVVGRGPRTSFQSDIAAPVQEKAELILADGKVIYLDSGGTGKLATQGGVDVTRKLTGEIVYSTEGSASAIVSYNTLRVPRGSKPVRLLLADGSLAWLNAASSITFPTAFQGKERKVTITGEAYFEVAKNAAVPFLVHCSDATITVMGTHFNVNSYEDESTARVTLLEGSVKVQVNEKASLLRPGQQARISSGQVSVANDVDIEEVMAWRNGQFYFSGSDIKTIMRQLEKYYDVDVVYQDEVRYRFVAIISREGNISELLKKLELTNLIHFKIDGKKIIVMK